jgi:copper transport outer membrane protein MctB
VINFRYHVVSLTAVFLALAIGLVVGTAALNGPVSDALNERMNALGKDNKQLREQVSHLEDEASRQDDWATQAAPLLLPNKLTGRKVVLVSLPSGRDYVKGVAEMLTMAGATVTGHVQIQDKFTDPSKSVDLLHLADEALPPSVPAGEIPHNSDGVETSSALLASVLLDGAAGEGAAGERGAVPASADHPPAVSATDRLAVLTAYTKDSYLSLDDNYKLSGPADATVVVDGLPYVDREASSRNDAVVTMVAQFDKAGAIVVTTPGDSGDGNVVTEVRGDPTLAKTVSTVDNAAGPQGTVAAALALALQFTSGKAGQYGNGAGASSMLPKQDQ